MFTLTRRCIERHQEREKVRKESFQFVGEYALSLCPQFSYRERKRERGNVSENDIAADYYVFTKYRKM